MPTNLKEETPVSKDQKKFVKGVSTGKSLARAAKDAGFMSQGYGSYLMKQPKIRQELALMLEEEGVTDERLAKKLDEILDAYTVKKDGGKEYPDYPTQLRAVETVFRVKKDIATEGATEKNTQINMILSPELFKGMKDSGILKKEEIIELEEIMEGEYAPKE